MVNAVSQLLVKATSNNSEQYIKSSDTGASPKFKDTLDKAVKQDAAQGNRTEDRPDQIKPEDPKKEIVDDIVSDVEAGVASEIVAIVALPQTQPVATNGNAALIEALTQEIVNVQQQQENVPEIKLPTVEEMLLQRKEAGEVSSFVKTALADINKLIADAQVAGANGETFAAVTEDSFLSKEAELQVVTCTDGKLDGPYVYKVTREAKSGASGDSQNQSLFDMFMPNAQIPGADPNAVQQNTAAPAPVVIDANQSAAQITTQIVESIEQNMQNGSKELSINFKPEVLGGLIVKLNMTADGLNAQIVASTRNANAVVTGEILQLQEMLRDRGIPVQRIEVVSQYVSQDANFGQQQQQQQFYGQGSKSNNKYYGMPSDDEGITAVESVYNSNSTHSAADSASGSSISFIA